MQISSLHRLAGPVLENHPQRGTQLQEWTTPWHQGSYGVTITCSISCNVASDTSSLIQNLFWQPGEATNPFGQYELAAEDGLEPSREHLRG